MTDLKVDDIDTQDKSDYWSDNARLEKKDIAKVIKMIRSEKSEPETFGWDGGDDPTVFAQRAIKRFRLKKLKSLNGRVYCYDKVTYYIWEYVKDSKTGVERLVKPSEEECVMLRKANEISYEPYLTQPDEFW